MNHLHLLYGGMCLWLLFSCSNSNQSADTKQTTNKVNPATTATVLPPITTKKTPPPTANRTSINFEEKLMDSFTKGQVDFLKKIEKDYQTIKNPEDLAIFYREKLPQVVELVNKKINQYDPESAMLPAEVAEKWAWFTDYMPYIKVALFCTECTTESYVLVQPLRERAEITNGKSDDKFFDALLIANQTADIPANEVCDKMPNSWTKLVNCDLCGTDILGNSKYLNTLQAVQIAKKEGNLFAKDLQNLWEQALPMTATNYYFDKETVLKELELIINTVELSKKEKENLKNLRYLLSVGKNVQFDCQDGNCQFLAM